MKTHLSHKIANNTSIIKAHSWSVCVKNPSNPNLQTISLGKYLIILYLWLKNDRVKKELTGRPYS